MTGNHKPQASSLKPKTLTSQTNFSL